jgi:HD-GYP domain-containing protein (c-di-GMP phosphodiesterase class II)
MKPENEKTVPLPIKDLAKKIICDGHLYFSSKEGRRFYMMKPGIMIDEAFIKKHATNQTVFDYAPVTDNIVTAQFTTLFRELKYLQFEKDLRVKTQDIVAFFKGTFEHETHFLSFAMACYNEFCLIPTDDLKRMHETDLHLFRKSLYSAAFAVIIGFTNDFYHYPMIKDLYNLTLGLDLGLCEENYSYFVAEACNRENQAPGTGQAWMTSEGATESELNVFLKHPETGHKYFKEHSDLFAYPELIQITLYQHELSNGKGFPRGIPKGQVSSWEAIVILADSLVGICDQYKFECEVMSYLFSFENHKLSDIPVQRVYQKLCMGLGDIFKLKEGAG